MTVWLLLNVAPFWAAALVGLAVVFLRSEP